MAPCLSFIIPCFNAAPWIRETLTSVSRQKYSPDAEVVVVDDGSTDGTGEIIRTEFPFVHVERTLNQGPSAARNLGTRLSTGEFIQYLDADDLLADGKVEWQRTVLEKTGADVAYGDWQWLVPEGEGFVPGERQISGNLVAPDLDYVSGFWCPTAAYLFRRTIVSRVGGWNESLRHGGEDERFLQDCAQNGARFVYVPEVMAHYRRSPGSFSQRQAHLGFRDHLESVLAAELMWLRSGAIMQDRRDALVSRLGRIARASCDRDIETFSAAVAAIERLHPGYLPPHPQHLRTASRFLGYRKAEILARWYRALRTTIPGGPLSFLDRLSPR